MRRCLQRLRQLGTSTPMLTSTRRWQSSFRGPPASEIQAKVVRFADMHGDQHFGVLTDDSTARFANIVSRSDDGQLEKSEVETEVGIILPPVDPPAIFCIGLNYLDHAKEVNKEPPSRPVVFLKATSCAIGHMNHITIPEVCQTPPEVDYEAELAVVIGRAALNVSREDAMDHVLGYTCANDVTARRWQGKKGGGQWARGKSFDSFAPLGPWVVPRAYVPDPHALRIRTILNGKVVQDGHTKNMHFTIPEIIEFLSQGTTLLPGTVILTGTPAGVGYTKDPPLFLKAGDMVEVEIEGVGKLSNPVVEARGPLTVGGPSL